ncbi:MAG: hypothetical protein NT062_13880, partial [Proteobacteria bacterium]|nr:hypothetical protein [Pseudomonadota bacterium]
MRSLVLAGSSLIVGCTPTTPMPLGHPARTPEVEVVAAGAASTITWHRGACAGARYHGAIDGNLPHGHGELTLLAPEAITTVEGDFAHGVLAVATGGTLTHGDRRYPISGAIAVDRACQLVVGEVRVEQATPDAAFVGYLDDRRLPTRGRLVDAHEVVVAGGYFSPSDADAFTLADQATCLAGDCAHGAGAEWHRTRTHGLYTGGFQDGVRAGTGTFREWRDSRVDVVELDGARGAIVRPGYRIEGTVPTGSTPRLDGERRHVVLASGEVIDLVGKDLVAHDVRAAQHPELPPGMTDAMAAMVLIAPELEYRSTIRATIPLPTAAPFVSIFDAEPHLWSIDEYLGSGNTTYVVGWGFAKLPPPPPGVAVWRSLAVPTTFVGPNGVTGIGEVPKEITRWPKFVASPKNWATRGKPVRADLQRARDRFVDAATAARAAITVAALDLEGARAALATARPHVATLTTLAA